MKIAFFDSGIGGLTVLNEAIRLFPNEEYIYFADSINAPYGSRSSLEVEALIIDAVDFLASKDIDVLVIACHTASRLMAAKLRNRKYPFKIIEMRSGITRPAILNKNQKSLVCATDLSINIWEEQLNTSPIDADYLSLQELVVFAEKFDFDSPKLYNYLRSKLSPINWDQYHSIVLGCTHFPFFKNQINSILPRSVKILDGSLATAKLMGKHIFENDFLKTSSIEYFTSKTSVDNTELFKYLDVLDTQYQPTRNLAYSLAIA